MRFIKPRKRRGIKADGTRSMDMCSGCIAFGCDPMAMSPRFQAKVRARRDANVCVSCGWNPCRCKSKGGISSSLVVSGNSRRLK